MGGRSIEETVQALQALSSDPKPVLSEYFKNFNSFVKTHNADIERNVASILEAFRPVTLLQRNLRFRLIDKYRVSSEVVVLLRSGDLLDLKHALKCDWFFEDLPSPNFFLETVPNLSYSARVKLINKYACCLKNGKTGEELYGNVKNRYGTKAAVALMPACGENFIRNELPNVKTSLPPSVALALYKKFPSLMIEYLKYLVDEKSPKNQRKGLSSYEGVFGKLASTDLTSFLDIFEDHGNHIPHVRLGRRATKKLIRSQSDKVLYNYSKYEQLLVDKTFFTRLSTIQMKILYEKSLLPTKVSNFLSASRWDKVHTTLKFVEPVLRPDLVLSSFKSKYGRDITSEDLLFNCNESWVEYLPTESKARWVESKISSTEDPTQQAQFLAMLPVEQSIPRLQKLIESQSDSKVRNEVARNLMVTVCKNNSAAAIKPLFAYFVKRFRNEVQKFRETIVNEMPKLSSLYLQLEISDWDSITEFINIIKLNKEIDSFRYYLRQVYSHQIHCCYLKKGNVDAAMAAYVDFEKLENGHLEVAAVDLCENTPYYRNCLVWFLNELPKIEWKDDSNKIHFLSHLIGNVVTYNKTSNRQIQLPNWIIDSLERYLNSPNPLLYRVQNIISIANRSSDEQFKSRILELAFPKFANCALVCRVLNKKPNKVLANVSEVLNRAMLSSFSDYITFYKKSRLYEALGIPEEIRKFCRVVLKLQKPDDGIDEDSVQDHRAPYAIQVLSVLEPPETFLQLVSSYVPSNPKIEEYSSDVQELYDIQKAVCQSFNNLSTPSATLTALRQFTVGDYLKLVVGSLVRVCTKVPEKDILTLFKDWIDCPVSLRKHFFRLTFIIAPTDYSVEFFVNIFKTEKNVSLRLVLFMQIYRAFVAEPSEESFKTLKSIITQLTVEDEEALKKLFEIDDLDECYVAQYLELLWNLVSTDWGSVLPNGRSKIVDLVDSKILRSLSEEFLEILLFNELSTKLPNFADSNFVYLYVLYSATYEVQRARLDKVLLILKPYMEEKWDESDFKRGLLFPIRSNFASFVSSLASKSVEWSDLLVSPVQVLNDVKTVLLPIVKSERFLTESFKLDLAVRQLQHKRSSSEEATLVSSLSQLYYEYIQKYGQQYGYPLINSLIQCAPHKYQNQLGFDLITKYSDSSCQLIGIEILNAHIDDEADVPLYKTVIDVLSTSEDLGVQLAANRFYSNLYSSLV